MKLIVLVLILLTGSLYSCPTYAQDRLQVSGIVADSTTLGIPGANVRLITEKDTLNSSTDSVGKFKFILNAARQFSITVSSIGYLAYSRNFTLTSSVTEYSLPLVVLQPDAKQLNEVVIKAPVIPVRLMKDTVEYAANAYTVRENDRVEDLLRQLPGIESDKDGNITATGKALTKIRVNGKDFFTGNVKEFIAQLPANIVDKLQVIDDYGDKANFTGVKRGEPQKILNLVLKGGRNGGQFGNVSASAGTNNRYALNLNGNQWEDTRQLGFNGVASNTNTGAGISTTSNLGINYRNKLGEKMIVSGAYNFGYNKNATVQQNYIESVNSLGTIYNRADNESSSRGNTHNFDLNLQSKEEVNYMQGSIRASLADTKSNNLSSSRQTGVIHQDLLTNSFADQQSPNVNADFNMGHKFDKAGRVLSAGFTAGSSLNNNNQQQMNTIGYYDPLTDLPLKDSILNQLVGSRNRTTTLNTTLTFSEPIGKQDSLLERNIDFSYVFSLAHTSNRLQTRTADLVGGTSLVDSLSNSYSSTFITQTIGVNYNQKKEKLNYSLGLNAQPNLLTGAYEGRTDKINRAGFNFSPVARISYTPSAKTVFGILYNGNSIAPNFNQLQPVRDNRNLQNSIVGNPNLKASFSHAVNLSYRGVNSRNGSTLQLVLRGTTVQDQVVTNTILLRDTLNGLKQETRYLNTDGYYNLGSNYYWSLPLSKRKYTLEVKGGVGYNHRVSYADNVKNAGKGLTFNQSAAMRMNQKWLMLYTSAGYNHARTTYALATAQPNIVKTWLFNLDAKTFVFKSFNAGVEATKTINQGYEFSGSSPLLIGGYVEQLFFKNRMASLRLTANDLLNQGNNLNRIVSENTITESRSNQVTRYFLLSFSWRLQRFPGNG